MKRREAAVVSALRLVALLVEYGNDHVFPLLWNFPLALDEGGKPVELQQDGPVLLKSEFQRFRGKAIGPHCFRVYHCLHRCGNLLRGLYPEGTREWMLRQSLRDVGISISDLAFGSERNNLTHLSRGYALCRAAVSLPRRGRTVIRALK